MYRIVGSEIVSWCIVTALMLGDVMFSPSSTLSEPHIIRMIKTHYGGGLGDRGSGGLGDQGPGVWGAGGPGVGGAGGPGVFWGAGGFADTFSSRFFVAT